MRKKFNEITYSDYGYGNTPYNITSSEIEDAVQNTRLEARSYQGQIDELVAEWSKKATCEQEYRSFEREYHIRRIAFFVVNGWTEPIVINNDGWISDGLHRLKAAAHKQMPDVDVIIK